MTNHKFMMLIYYFIIKSNFLTKKFVILQDNKHLRNNLYHIKHKIIEINI